MRTIKRIRRIIFAAPFVGAALAMAGCSAAESAPVKSAVSVTLGAAAGNPTVAVAPDGGTVFVAWVEGAEGERNVYLSRLTPTGERQGEAVRVNATPGDASMHEAAPPQVALGPAGEVYVVWESSYAVEGRRHPASNLRFARSLDGGRSFGLTVTVNSDPGMPSSHTFHNVAVAPDGAIYVSWLDGRERDRARARLALHAPAQQGGGAGEHGAHGHGAHGGNAASSSTDAELPGSELWVAVSRDGGESFQEVSVVDRGVCPCCRTGLAIGPDGSVYVVWRKIFEGDVRDIAIARSTDGGATFGEPAPVHRDGWVFPGCPHVGPTIAIGDDGTVHVAWYTGKDGEQGTFYAASTDGGRNFSAPLGLLTGEWVPPSITRVATVGSEVWVAWDDRREEKDNRAVHLARVERGRLVEPVVLRGTTPDLALTQRVRVLAWHHGETVQLHMVGE
jgi:hypothetical protein